MRTRYVYGPVPSRRLGRSLGVDLVPYKTCSYDCIYCQLGRTTCQTIERAEYVSCDALLAQLDQQLASVSEVDYITLAGSGEPTLNSEIGRVIRGVKERTRIPVAVITNGSLLWRKEVREAVAQADVVLPSLDAGDALRFATVNRPHHGVSFGRMIGGLERFRERFEGEIWLEVFLVGGITGTRAAARRIARLARGIRPDRIQLNTASRPTADEVATRVPAVAMEELALLFGPHAEVISDTSLAGSSAQPATDDDILALLGRRPSTSDGVSLGLGLPVAEAIKRLAALCERRLVTATRGDRGVFYSVARGRS